MTISIQGSDNPDSIPFMGTDLTKVDFMGTTVWGHDSGYGSYTFWNPNVPSGDGTVLEAHIDSSGITGMLYPSTFYPNDPYTTQYIIGANVNAGYTTLFRAYKLSGTVNWPNFAGLRIRTTQYTYVNSMGSSFPSSSYSVATTTNYIWFVAYNSECYIVFRQIAMDGSTGINDKPLILFGEGHSSVSSPMYDADIYRSYSNTYDGDDLAYMTCEYQSVCQDANYPFDVLYSATVGSYASYKFTGALNISPSTGSKYSGLSYNTGGGQGINQLCTISGSLGTTTNTITIGGNTYTRIATLSVSGTVPISSTYAIAYLGYVTNTYNQMLDSVYLIYVKASNAAYVVCLSARNPSMYKLQTYCALRSTEYIPSSSD